MKHKIILLIVSIFLTGIAFGQVRTFATKIYDRSAKDYIGDACTVSGIVANYQFVNHSKTLLLHCGTGRPERVFTVIVADKGKRPVPVETLKGWCISVYGLIVNYEGKAAIKVPNLQAIQTVKFDERAPGDI